MNISYSIILPFSIVVFIAIYVFVKRYLNVEGTYRLCKKDKENLIEENSSLKKKVEEIQKKLTISNHWLEGYRKKNQDLKKSFEIQIDVRENEYKKLEIQLKKDSQKRFEDLCKRKMLEWHELEELYKSRLQYLKELLDSSNIAEFSASMYADVETYVCKLDAEWLEKKNPPAPRTAAEVKYIVNEKCKIYLKQYREMLYKYEYLMKSFPELEDYVENIETLRNINYDNLAQYGADYDRTHDFLSKEEYANLSSVQRNQLALDRYINSHNKTDWQIGRDYELFCGHKLRTISGIITVEQHGIENGLEDLGRDIIARDARHIYIIQCKYWSQHKEIHEKHIAQLYGSAKEFEIHNSIRPEIKVVPVFITNTQLSNAAKQFALFLGVELRQWDMEEFPRIKCNTSSAGEKIYHLPFDQQYDATKITGDGDCYAMTVAKAERMNYRRAYKWNGH